MRQSGVLRRYRAVQLAVAVVAAGSSVFFLPQAALAQNITVSPPSCQPDNDGNLADDGVVTVVIPAALGGTYDVYLDDVRVATGAPSGGSVRRRTDRRRSPHHLRRPGRQRTLRLHTDRCQLRPAHERDGPQRRRGDRWWWPGRGRLGAAESRRPRRCRTACRSRGRRSHSAPTRPSMTEPREVAAPARPAARRVASLVFAAAVVAAGYSSANIGWRQRARSSAHRWWRRTGRR